MRGEMRVFIWKEKHDPHINLKKPNLATFPPHNWNRKENSTRGELKVEINHVI